MVNKLTRHDKQRLAGLALALARRGRTGAVLVRILEGEGATSADAQKIAETIERALEGEKHHAG